MRHLTVKLRGRAPAPSWSRGCMLSLGARGESSGYHWPLERLLGCISVSALITASQKVAASSGH